MNLKNKTDKELWDMLNRLQKKIDKKRIMIGVIDYKRYSIHQEIIRREKGE